MRSTLKGNARNYVYLTRDELSPELAWLSLFAGDPAYANRGDYYFLLRIRDGATLIPGTQPNEVIHVGSIRFGRHATLLAHGANPF